MTDPMHDRCPALEPGTGERCVLYAKHISDGSGVHVATGSWPVEGSTPLDSPARAVLREQVAAWRSADQEGYDPGDLAEAAEALLDRLDAGPAGEAVSVPPPESLDAILNLVEEVALARVKAHVAANRDDGPRAAQHGARAKGLRLAIAVEIEGVRAAGVEEGRRAQLAELEPAPPKPGNPAYADEYEQGIFDEGIREGRRQATEERTEEHVRLAVSLDSPAYRTQLLKMIRTGEIRLPEMPRG